MMRNYRIISMLGAERERERESMARGVQARDARRAVRAGGISTGCLQTTQTILENSVSLKAERV